MLSTVKKIVNNSNNDNAIFVMKKSCRVRSKKTKDFCCQRQILKSNMFDIFSVFDCQRQISGYMWEPKMISKDKNRTCLR